MSCPAEGSPPAGFRREERDLGRRDLERKEVTVVFI
jgi:hypothetical protein